MQPPLWRQLQLTAGALASIRAGTSGSVAFEAVEPALRPGVQALGFQVLRWLGRAEA
ncbi:16S rRNA (cytosine(967)-C(5))-methyltransferase RsmB, partial [Variovorax sp. CT11-76]